MATILTLPGSGLFATFDVQSGNADMPADARPPIPPSVSIALEQGTGLGKADQLHFARYTLAASASVTIDLVAGALLDPFGAVLSFNKVKIMNVWLAAGASAIIIGNAATPWAPFFDAGTDTFTLRNGPTGGYFGFGCDDTTGYPAVGGASDKLKFANADAGVAAVFQLLLVGSSV